MKEFTFVPVMALDVIAVAHFTHCELTEGAYPYIEFESAEMAKAVYNALNDNHYDTSGITLMNNLLDLDYTYLRAKRRETDKEDDKGVTLSWLAERFGGITVIEGNKSWNRNRGKGRKNSEDK